MHLNVLGSMLLPYAPNKFADERTPICITVAGPFKEWCVLNGFDQFLDQTDIGSKTCIEPDMFVMAYKDGCAPPMLAEHSHEKAVYWFPIEMFSLKKDN